MKDNKAYGHSTMRVAETVPGCEAEYEEVDRVKVSGGNQGGGIEMKKNEAYAQPIRSAYASNHVIAFITPRDPP